MNQKKIGHFIAYCRKQKKMTQEELAEKLRVSDRTIGNWENGRNMPDLSLFKPLCKELDITINELLSGEKITREDYPVKCEENVVNTIDYSSKKIMKAYKLIYLLLIIFGLFIAISAITICPVESSWGSIYTALGMTIFIIGIGLNFKYLGVVKQSIILIVTTLITLSILLFSDYISVKENNQVPRFRINVTTRQEVVVYETLFYNVYKYRDQIYVDEHKSIDDINWQVILKKLKISSNQ